MEIFQIVSAIYLNQYCSLFSFFVDLSSYLLSIVVSDKQQPFSVNGKNCLGIVSRNLIAGGNRQDNARCRLNRLRSSIEATLNLDSP